MSDRREVGRPGLYEAGRAKILGLFTVPPLQVAEEEILRHAVLIDSQGMPVRFGTEPVPFTTRDHERAAVWPRMQRQMSDDEYRSHLGAMLDHLVAESAAGRCREGVLLIIHGGNEPPHRTMALSEKMLQDVVRGGWYPIFVNWDSSITNAYAESLLRIRSGRYCRHAFATSLLHFFADLVAGLIRTPYSAGIQLRLLAQGTRLCTLDTQKDPGP